MIEQSPFLRSHSAPVFITEILSSNYIYHHAVINNDLSIFTNSTTFSSSNLYCRDLNGYTILHHICELNRYQILSYILEHHIDLFFEETFECAINVKNFNRETPLHLACLSGSIYVIKLLFVCQLQSIIKLNERNVNNFTPLLLAWTKKHKNIVKILLNHNADYNLTMRNHNNELIKVPDIFVRLTLLEERIRKSRISLEEQRQRNLYYPRVSPMIQPNRFSQTVIPRVDVEIKHKFSDLPKHFTIEYLEYLEKTKICPICFEKLEKDKITVTTCFHYLCNQCFHCIYRDCPMCRRRIK